MTGTGKQNANPIVYSVGRRKQEPVSVGEGAVDEDARDTITPEEIFELIRNLNDPEHPLSLEQLKVATLENVQVDDDASQIHICFTPTIPHCRFKVRVEVTPGTHASETAINKQLNDKERVAAALENGHLLATVNKCLQEKAELGA